MPEDSTDSGAGSVARQMAARPTDHETDIQNGYFTLSDSERSARIEIVLAEYNALRKEIADRSTSQGAMLGLNMTAIATVLGFVLTQRADPILALILPVLCPAIGMLYVDHAINISMIGTYVGGELRAACRDLSRSEKIQREYSPCDYEHHARAHEKDALARYILFGAPVLLMIAGVPLGVLASALIYIPPLPGWTPIWFLWGLGAVLEAAFLFFWIRYLGASSSSGPTSPERT